MPNPASIKKLMTRAGSPPVETFILGLQYVCEPTDSIVGFCLGPSAVLMRHALDVGVLPNYYVTLEQGS